MLKYGLWWWGELKLFLKDFRIFGREHTIDCVSLQKLDILWNTSALSSWGRNSIVSSKKRKLAGCWSVGGEHLRNRGLSVVSLLLELT